MTNHDGASGAPAGPDDASQPPAPPQDRFGGQGAAVHQDPSAARVGAGLKKGAGFLRPSEWASSAIVAASAYAAMLVVAVLITAVVMTVGLAEAEDYTGFTPYTNISDSFSGGRAAYLFCALFLQLVAMAVGGRFHLSVESSYGSSYSSHDELAVFLRLIPVLVTLAGAVALYYGSRAAARRQVLRFQEGRSADPVSGRSLWLSSLVTGAMLTVLIAGLSAIFAGRASQEIFGVDATVHFSAVNPVVFFLPLVFGTLLSQWGRRSALAPMPHRFSDQVHAFLPGIATAARLAGLYLAVLAVLCLVILAVVVGVRAHSFAAGATVLFFGAFLAGDLLAAAHVSGIVSTRWYSDDSESIVMYLWSDGLAPSGMLVWILVLAGLLALAFAWAGRRPSSAHPVSWGVMPLVFLLLGFVVLWAGRMHAGAEEGMEFSAGPGWWTPVVFLLWGVLVEVLARFLVPAVVGVLPNNGFRRLLLGTPVEPVFSRSAQNASAGQGSWAGQPGEVGQPGQAAAGAVPPPPPGVEQSSADQADAAPAGSQAPAYATAGQQQAGAAYPGQQPGLAARERTPMSPAAKKRLRLSAIVAGVVVLLLVMAFAAVKIVNATVYSPEHVVEDYFNAVVDGNAQDAVDTIDPNVGSDQRALLTNEVYQNATKKITEYDIKDIDVADGGDSATATVAVTQDQRTTDTQVNLVKAGGTMGLVQWEIDSQQAGLYKTIDYTVPAGTDTVTVNGQEVHVHQGAAPSSSSSGYDYGSSSEESGNTLSLTVLPGQYTFGAPKGGTYLTYGEDQQVMVQADADSSSSVSFQQKLTEQAFTEATAQAKTKLDECAAVQEFEVPACGLDSYHSGDDYRNPSWSIQKYPEYVVSNSSYPGSSSSEDEVDPSQKLYVATTSSGTAKLDYQYKGFDDEWEDEDSEHTISGYFPLEVTPDKITLGDAE